MRYLTLVEALVVAEAVTGISSEVLGRSARVGLLDSALHAPAAASGPPELACGVAMPFRVMEVAPLRTSL